MLYISYIDESLIPIRRGFVGVSDTVILSKFLLNTGTKKGGLEGFIVKYRNTGQILGNFPSPTGDKIP